MANEMVVRISPVVLLGETTPTYFIDTVEGHDCRNLRSTKDEGKARLIAAEFAAAYGVQVRP